jgi:hypothetical protein|tara:strand:+ start:4165 stop:6021 length:1857 start_codon:yes stop_codon:yes gene_type:complete
MPRTVPGSGASIEPIFNSTYGVKDVFVVNGGSGYDASDPPKLTIGNCGTPVRDAVLRPVINTAGEIQAVEVLDPGEGYSPLRLIIESTDDGAFGATGDVFLNATGGIDYIQVRSNGDSYFGGTTARIEGGGGAGSELVPITGSVTGLSLENVGRNYTRQDVALVIGGGGGEGATGVAEVNEFGQIENINISNPGEFFETPPIVQLIGGGGSGAAADAVINLGRIESINITNPGGGYTSPPQVIFARNTNLVRTARNRQSLNSTVFNITGLTGDIAESDTTINVETTAAFPGSGKALVGREIFRYTSKTATQFKGVTRGVNFKFDQKIRLDNLQDDPNTGLTGYEFNINDRVRRLSESSDNKIAIVYDWRPETRDLYLVFQVDELAFIDAGRSTEESKIVAFICGVASSSGTGVEPHVLVESEGNDIVLFTNPLSVLPDRVFEDNDELEGAGDGIPDLINTGTDFEFETSLDGGIASSLYGIEETIGGQNTTLLAVGDKIYDGNTTPLVATVQSAGALGDGDQHDAIITVVGNNWSIPNFVAGETVTGGTSGVVATVDSFTATATGYGTGYITLVLRDPVGNGNVFKFTNGETLSGGTSGGSANVWSAEYSVLLRNEPE